MSFSDTNDQKSTHDAIPDERNREVRIYINGRFYPREEARISVFDSGYLIGDGVWEGLRLHRGRFLFLERHLDRLFQGARAIALEIGKSREELEDALYATAEENGMESDVHARLMVTRGIKKTPSQDPRLTVTGPNIVIIAEYKVADPAIRRRGLNLLTSAVRRGSPDYLDPRLNCHSKLHEVVALVQAIEAGADEALMLDTRGFVSTCNATNFFLVRRRGLWTSSGAYCMNGITRAIVLEIAPDIGLAVQERDFSLVDVYDADEAFVTGTFGGITPVARVDGRSIGTSMPGPCTGRLIQRYEQEIEKEVNR